MNPQTLHGGRPITAERARLDQIVLADVLVLKVGPHRYLPLEPPITYGTMVRQGLCVSCKVLSQVVLSKEALLAHATLVRLNARVPHLVPPHVGTVREFHVAHVALEELPVGPAVGGGGPLRRLRSRRHIIVVLGHGALCHVRRQLSVA